MKHALLAATMLAFAAETPAIGAVAHTAPVQVTIDGAARRDSVTRYEYGMFIELIGNLVARTLWAEMLDDRKFYFAVVPQSKDAPPPANAQVFPGMAGRKWRPIGADGAVTMDTRNPYVGKQSPSITLSAEGARGLGQSGIGIAAGKRYDGYLYLSGDPGAKVQASLIWGPGPNDRQSVTLPAPTSEWQRVPFGFTPSRFGRRAI